MASRKEILYLIFGVAVLGGLVFLAINSAKNQSYTPATATSQHQQSKPSASSSAPQSEPASPPTPSSFLNSVRLAARKLVNNLDEILRHNGYAHADCDEYYDEYKNEYNINCLGGGAAYGVTYVYSKLKGSIEWDPGYPGTSLSIARKLFHEIVLFAYGREFFNEMDKMLKWVDKTMDRCLALRGRGVQWNDIHKYYSERSKKLLITINCKHYPGEYHNLLVVMEFTPTTEDRKTTEESNPKSAITLQNTVINTVTTISVIIGIILAIIVLIMNITMY